MAAIKKGLVIKKSVDSADESLFHLNLARNRRGFWRIIWVYGVKTCEFRNKVKDLCIAYPHSIYSCLPASDNRIALTFDDGPDPHITPLVLDILEEYNTVATFFVIGENAQKYTEVVQRIVKSGHQLANHSWSHKRPTSITVYDLIDEVNKTQKVIEEKYACTKFFRPPYGLVTY